MALRNDDIAFAFLIAAVTAVTLGHSAVLPFLPDLVARTSADSDEVWRGRHVAALAAAFPVAACVSAPLWGRLSDRWRRRPLLLMGLLGFSLALAFSGPESIARLYAFRLLAGACAAAVVPTAFALIADGSPDLAQRARRFTWLNAFIFAGELSGPLVAEFSVALNAPPTFYLPALLVAGAMLGVQAAPLTSAAASGTLRQPTSSVGVTLAPLLLISATAAGGLSALHVMLTLQSDVRFLPRETVSWLLSLCGGAMLVAQIGQFTGRRVAQHAANHLRPLLAVLAAALVASTYATSGWALAPVILLAGWSTATLKLFTSYLTSRASSQAQGFGLSLQFAAISAGQAAASFATGWIGRSDRAVLWFLAAAAVALIAFTPKGQVGAKKGHGGEDDCNHG